MEYFNRFETASFLLLYLKTLYRRRLTWDHVNTVKVKVQAAASMRSKDCHLTVTCETMRKNICRG